MEIPLANLAEHSNRPCKPSQEGRDACESEGNWGVRECCVPSSEPPMDGGKAVPLEGFGDLD